MQHTTKLNLIRFALAIGCVAIIISFLPRANHQEFSYEEGQPWKYPLLTAQFDTPIMRDSTSARLMRDSIDKAFVPFIRRDDARADLSVERFRNSIKELVPAREFSILATEMQNVYNRGIVDKSLYELIRTQGHGQLRTVHNGGPETSASTIDASAMLTPRLAYAYIDSAYRARMGNVPSAKLTPAIGNAISSCLAVNVLIDTVTDLKYRNNEYVAVSAGLGVIKEGQRIVDRGEIITPQIYTILNTYSEMLRNHEESDIHSTDYYLGQVLFVLLNVGILYLFLMIYRWRFFDDIRSMVFLMSIITLFVVFTILMFESFEEGTYLVPFAAVPVIVLIFFDSRTAIFALITTIMLSATVAIYPFQFIFMQLCAGLVATFSISQLSRRSQLLRTALLTFVMYMATYFITSLMFDGNLTGFTWRIVAYFAINSVVLSFAYILVVVIERLFGFTSTVTLVELSDINNKLLRRLAEEAPGTFQHSMQVSMLASEAARAVKANTQLVRTGALYHDIGKLESPIFFTENQHGINPHAGLDPETSAKKIISHVTEGAKIAQREKLPKVIRDFITEHHGRGMAKYFYTTACNASPDGKADPELFTYPGPNPQSKETAILMMADAVEAASRSLPDYSQQSISELVDRIIDSQMHDGLFKDSPISFRDVEVIKNTFKKRLATMYHSRIAYPELKRRDGKEVEAAK